MGKDAISWSRQPKDARKTLDRYVPYPAHSCFTHSRSLIRPLLPAELFRLLTLPLRLTELCDGGDFAKITASSSKERLCVILEKRGDADAIELGRSEVISTWKTMLLFWKLFLLHRSCSSFQIPLRRSVRKCEANLRCLCVGFVWSVCVVCVCMVRACVYSCVCMFV